MEVIRVNFENKNIFITGADGFVGGWLAKELASEGANVIALVQDIGKECPLDLHGIRNDITVVSGNIVDYDTVKSIINEYSIEYCFHLAAQALVGIASKSPLPTFETNIKGTWNVLEVCRTSDVEGIIVASSDKAYGEQELPYTEDKALLGAYPYDASKACADILSRCFFKTYGLPVAVTRCANIYGGGDLNFSRIVPDAVCSALMRKNLVIRSDGKMRRDYMYVKDAINGYLILAKNLHRKDVKGEAFNFGTDISISVLDLFKKIIELCGSYIEPIILGEAKNEIPNQFLSFEKAEKLLGWMPKYSLEEGLKETIEWYRQYLKDNGLLK